MRRPGLLAVTLLCAASATSLAIVPHKNVKVAADVLTAMPAAGLPSGSALRRARDVRYGTANAPAAWAKFAAAAGGLWTVSWDRATNVPTRIWGSGIPAPGAMTSPAIAEKVARAWLGAHLALLAPGATAADFVLVSNSSDGDIRSVGFVQQHEGRRVLGGQIGFEFKRDRLFVIGSTALPNVTTSAPTTRLAPTALRARALIALRDQLAEPTGSASAPGAEVIVPLLGEDSILGYRVATPVTLAAGADGAYLAYVDPTSGEPIAVIQRDRFATGTVTFNGVDRYPGRGRLDKPAPREHVTLGGMLLTTDNDGHISWSPDVTKSLTPAVDGEQVAVHNTASAGIPATTTLSIDPGGSARWDASAVVEDDSQLITFLAINTVKSFIRDHIDAQMPTIDTTIDANVNIAQDCNAFFDGTSVNFFHASSMCENTGRVEDVMYHEFGHSLHEHEIIEGVGAFDGAMSEGAADTLAVNITNDSGLGRGFFYTDKPLRELDPPDSEATFPRDIGEIHKTGMIYGGTWWDIRKAALAQFGETDGEALTLRLYLGTLRRSVDIPSSLVEALATDDDDGDLSNGTPHECMIRDNYAAHGMHTTSGVIDGPGLVTFHAGSIQVHIDLTGTTDRCLADQIDTIVLDWGDGAKGIPVAGSMLATAGTPDRYYAQLQLPTDGGGSYAATVNFKQGSKIKLPDNRADPRYQVYQAKTVPLYCTDFESGDPLAEGWTAVSNTAGGGRTTDWAWTIPNGSGATDPPAAYSGTHALVQAPGGDYDAMGYSSVTMPPIDVRPYSDVRLQYRRWLAVQDSHFDQAKITANGKQVWGNTTSNMGDTSQLQHIDKEWRFQDVPLSGLFSGSAVSVGWEITSDGGLQLGGWALDDVCIVANPESICGDGVRTITEQCDDGAANADKADSCRTNCEIAHCGDGIVDTGEDCDGGASGTSTCTKDCKVIPVAPGGCAADGAQDAALASGLLIGVALLRRRRRT